jgi:molecular chaperone GrpE
LFAAAADEVAQLKESLAEIQAKHDEVLDKYRRSIAENDNMRKRLTKQIEDAKIFGIQSFCKDLLDVADVLNRAVSSNSGADTSNQAVLDMLQVMKIISKHQCCYDC